MASGKPVTSNLIAPQKQLPRWGMALPFQVVRLWLANIRRDIQTLRYQTNWPETSHSSRRQKEKSSYSAWRANGVALILARSHDETCRAEGSRARWLR